MEEIIAFPLILAILAAYYRTADTKKKAYVLSFSVVAGIISALISAYIRRLPNFVNRANLGFYSMIPVIISAVLILLILIFEKKIKSKNETFFENLLGAFVSVNIISSFFCYMPSFFLQIDSFVYYGESAVSTIVLFRVIGFVLAIIMLLLSLFVIYRTCMKLDAGRLKGILIFCMLVRGVTQLNVIVSRLYSLKIIPKNPIVFTVMAYITNNARIFDFALMSVLITVPVILWMQNIKITEKYRNNAEFRKIVYNMRRKRHLAQFFVFVMIVNILSLSAIKTYANREIPLSAPEDYKLENGHVEIELESVSDGHLHRYVYEAKDGKKVRFIVVQKSQGSYGVGLDACEICGPSGYFERNNEVVCKLCDVVMNKGTIGFKGGCNPIPFEYKVHDQKIKIDIEVLEGLSYVFK